MQPPACDKCNTHGLPILLARYCVVPKDVPNALPAWAGAKHVKDVDVGPDYHYALRTLRTGYVYLFYDKNQYGSNKWECYTVNEDGSLVKQLSAEMALPPTDKVQCSTAGHNAHDTHIIVIERPDKCGKAWIAFSEHKWSNDTLKRYATDAKLRDARMQTVKVPALATTGQHSHGSEANKAALESIIEYALGFDVGKLPNASALVGTFSKEDGSYNEAHLARQSTRHPWHLRTGQAEKTVERMKARAKRTDGGSNVPSVLALWDAVGIAHELNGFRNEAAGRINQYGQERELELTAMNAIDGLSVALAERAGGAQKQFQDEYQHNNSYAQELSEIQLQRANASKLPEPQRSRALEVCDIREDWARREVPKTLSFGIRLDQANMSPEPRRSQEIAAIKRDVDTFLSNRERNYHKNIADAKADAWPKYEKKLKPGALEGFRKRYTALIERAQTLADTRTEVVIKWLEAPLFLATLEDCHPNNIQDGIEFEDKIGNALFAINASPAGKKKIQEWVNELSATASGNLVWRTLALNQAQTATELNAALQEAAKHHAERTLSRQIDVASKFVKVFKSLADTHKKANGIFNANEAAKKGDQVFGARISAIKTGYIDKYAMTVGDAIYERFRINGIADYASEKIIQHALSLRGFVDEKDSLKLILAQSANLETANGQLLRRLNTAKAFLASDLPEMKTAQAENLRAAWSEFKATNSGAANAIKDARLAIVVGLIEALNFAKLMNDCRTKNDAKSWGGLAASGLSITSALFDVASAPAKALFGKESWSYQRIKLFGGVLSVGATFVGVVLDGRDMESAKEKGKSDLAKLYQVKFYLGMLSMGFSAASTLTYSAPLVARLTGRVAAGATMRAIGGRAAALIGARVLMLSVGAWITIGTLAVQGMIWYFTPDALQDWCEECAFGPRKKKRSSQQQDEALGKALVEIAVIREEDLKNMKAVNP